MSPIRVVRDDSERERMILLLSGPCTPTSIDPSILIFTPIILMTLYVYICRHMHESVCLSASPIVSDVKFLSFFLERNRHEIIVHISLIYIRELQCALYFVAHTAITYVYVVIKYTRSIHLQVEVKPLLQTQTDQSYKKQQKRVITTAQLGTPAQYISRLATQYI